MKNKTNILVGALAVFGSFSLVTTLTNVAFAKGPVASQEKQEKKEGTTKEVPMTKPVSKITPSAAMKAAEKKTGGKAVMAIFEWDEGHWIYGVVTVKNHKITEVDVDPNTGVAGATEAGTPEAEAAEMKDALAKFIK